MIVPVPGPDPVGPRRADTQAVTHAVAGLDAVADRPLAEHVIAFERMHAVLGDALAAGDG